MSAVTIDKTLGLRERNKLQKRRRIYQVARKLFEKQGYDSTTMRQIARAADVGEGTVFLYARDKRELIFLIFKDDLTVAINDAFKKISQDAGFLDQLLAFVVPMIKVLQPHPALARIMVREQFNLTGSTADEVAQVRESINSKLGQILHDAQRRKEIRSDIELAALIDSVWANFRFYVDDWLGTPKPVLQDIARRLRDGLELLFEGIGTESSSHASRPRIAKPKRKGDASEDADEKTTTKASHANPNERG
jgi:AcrR family transcriptional regulator